MEIHPVKTVGFNENEFPEIDTRPVVYFVGINNHAFRSEGMIKGFNDLGYQVEFLDWQKVKAETDVDELRSVMRGKCAISKIDLIFLHVMTEGILDSVLLTELSEVAPTVIYNLDCRTKQQTEWLYELCPHASLVCFSNEEDVFQANKLGFNNVINVHSSTDYEHYMPIRKQFIKEEYKHDIVFVGNRYDNTNMIFDNSKERKEMVDFLTETYGDRFKAYGIGFPGGYVDMQKERLIYCASKIAITHNNFIRGRYQSDRAYRSMGCGCFTILRYYPGINKDFSKHECSTWINFDMLKQEIDKHLEDSGMRIEKATRAAQFVRNFHSWSNRFLEIIEKLKELGHDKITV